MNPALYPEYWKGYRYEDQHSISRLDWLASILEVARQQEIEVYLFISPHHSRTAEYYRLMGWWPAYEQWLRDLPRVVEAHNAEYADKKKVPLWNFCCYSSINMDPWVAGAGVPRSFNWHADSYHYYTNTGNLALDLMLDHKDPARPIPPDFGTKLTTANAEAVIEGMRAARETYAAAFTADIAEQAEIVKAMRPR
jgi:hypothetical protein